MQGDIVVWSIKWWIKNGINAILLKKSSAAVLDYPDIHSNYVRFLQCEFHELKSLCARYCILKKHHIVHFINWEKSIVCFVWMSIYFPICECVYQCQVFYLFAIYYYTIHPSVCTTHTYVRTYRSSNNSINDVRCFRGGNVQMVLRSGYRCTFKA